MPDTNDCGLLEKMNQSVACNMVTAGFENEVPAQYKVRILIIGATIRYDDGTNQVLGPVTTSIGSGGYEALVSDCTDKCCNAIFGAMTVQQDGKKPVNISEWRYPGSGQCLLVTRFVLVIKKSVSKDRLLSGNLEDLLEIVVE